MEPTVLKALGAGLVLACGSGAAWLVADSHARRLAQLVALRSALQVLLTEIDYGLTPLPQALRRAASGAPGAVGRLLAAAADRLAARPAAGPGPALAEALAGSDVCLTAADRGVLLALAASLGASGRQDQRRHLELALRRLELAEDEARQEGERRRRLALSLGVLGSLAVVLVAV